MFDLELFESSKDAVKSTYDKLVQGTKESVDMMSKETQKFLEKEANSNSSHGDGKNRKLSDTSD